MAFYRELEQATAAERAALQQLPLIRRALDGRATRAEYLAFLTRAFHHVRHTVPLLMACGARLPDRLEWLRGAFAHYVEEELGHHEWILEDIAAAGGDAEAVRVGLPDFDTDVFVAYAWDTVQRRNPVGLLGMVYVLEGTSVRLACAVADAVQARLGLPDGAFTYLRSHGALDVDHLDHFAQLVDSLPTPADRHCVERSAKTFFRLYANVLGGIEAPAPALTVVGEGV